MVTTNRLIPIDAFSSDPDGLIHLTGRIQMAAWVTLGGPDAVAAHVEFWFDAAQVRGTGLENGVRYQARGAYRFIDDLGEIPVPLKLVGAFELLAYGPGDPTPTRLLLVVPFRVTVQSDGRVMAHGEAPALLPCPGG